MLPTTRLALARQARPWRAARHDRPDRARSGRPGPSPARSARGAAGPTCGWPTGSPRSGSARRSPRYHQRRGPGRRLRPPLLLRLLRPRRRAASRRAAARQPGPRLQPAAGSIRAPTWSSCSTPRPRSSTPARARGRSSRSRRVARSTSAQAGPVPPAFAVVDARQPDRGGRRRGPRPDRRLRPRRPAGPGRDAGPRGRPMRILVASPIDPDALARADEPPRRRHGLRRARGRAAPAGGRPRGDRLPQRRVDQQRGPGGGRPACASSSGPGRASTTSTSTRSGGAGIELRRVPGPGRAGRRRAHVRADAQRRPRDHPRRPAPAPGPLGQVRARRLQPDRQDPRDRRARLDRHPGRRARLGLGDAADRLRGDAEPGARRRVRRPRDRAGRPRRGPRRGRLPDDPRPARASGPGA